MPTTTATRIVKRTPAQPAYLNGRSVAVYLDAFARTSA